MKIEEQWVVVAAALGFSKITIIGRPDLGTLASTSAQDVASTYMDGGLRIDENQELLADWKDPNVKTFRFYRTKFNIVQRDDEGDWIVAAKNNQVCLVYKFHTIWFVVYGEIPKGVKKDRTTPSKFKSVPDAYNVMINNIWNALIEAGI